MKRCSKCEVKKPLDQFGSDKRKPDGKKYQCKTCHNAQNTAHRRANPQNHRKTNLAYARSPHGRALQRANNLRRKFWPNLTNEQAVAEYGRILAEQNECCALCGKHQSEMRTNFHVDHCHETGMVRGLLCDVCNRVEVQDKTLERVLRLVDYFSKYHK